MLKCVERNCSYYWQDENDLYPRCHFEDEILPAPCEDGSFDYDEEDDSWDDEPDDIDSDEGFDPYEGCFTFDC